MKKIKVPAKTVQNFETVFDNLHSAWAFNLTRREDRTYKNYGLLFLNENDTPTSNDWKVEVLTPYTQTKFRTRVGTSGKALGLLSSGEIVGISADKDVNLSSYQANKFYLVYVIWDSVGTEPIQTADGFMYNPDGSSNTQNTVYLDRTTITVIEKSTLSSALSTANEYINDYTDRVPLAVLKTEESSVEWDMATSFDKPDDVKSAKIAIVQALQKITEFGKNRTFDVSILKMAMFARLSRTEFEIFLHGTFTRSLGIPYR